MSNQDRCFREETDVLCKLIPLRHRAAYLNYSCLPRAP